VIRLFKEGEDIDSSLQIGDILEVEPGVFVRVLDIIKETEEDFAGIKKLNIHLKGEVISNYANTRKEPKGFRSRNS
jgi:hypothetical protein